MATSTKVIELLIESEYPGWEGYCNLDLKKPSKHSIVKNYLNKTQCKTIIDAITITDLQDPDYKRRKIGFNGNTSVFKYLNYFDFSRSLKNTYKETIPTDLQDTSLESWIMYFNNTNFYDLWFAPEHTTHWVYSISLFDNQQFELDYNTINVNAGDLVKFETRIPHEVKPVDKTTVFLNFFLLNNKL